MSDYEDKLFEKLMTVLRAANQNPAWCSEVEIKTNGYQPHASVTIPGYVLEKFVRKLGK